MLRMIKSTESSYSLSFTICGAVIISFSTLERLYKIASILSYKLMLRKADNFYKIASPLGFSQRTSNVTQLILIGRTLLKTIEVYTLV